MEIGRTNQLGSKDENISFKIYDYVCDIHTLFNDIYNTFEQSWEITFDMLKNCESKKFKDDKLSTEQIEKSNAIGFLWNLKNEKHRLIYSIAVGR